MNDFEGLFPDDKRVLFYPASYRVPYQQEQTDNANVVARAEVLEKLNDKHNSWVVTYPEALFEKIPTKKNLVKHTMRLEVAKTYSTDFLNDCFFYLKIILKLFVLIFKVFLSCVEKSITS